MFGTVFLPFLVGVAAVVVVNVAARAGMKKDRFNDRPGPRHIGS